MRRRCCCARTSNRARPRCARSRWPRCTKRGLCTGVKTGPSKQDPERSTMFAIKAEVVDPQAKTFSFDRQKTMYGGRKVATGDRLFIFASENEGGPGLVAV